jgi:hypothetical protein
MSFYSNIPTTPQSLGNSRPLINSNFTVLDKTFAKDHVEFNDANGLGPGKHVSQHFPFEATNAQKATAVGEIDYYMKLVSGIPRLFFREPNNGTEQKWSGKVFFDQGTLELGGFIPLFGGAYLAFGAINLASQTATPILFATECGSAFTSACYNVMATPADLTSAQTKIITVTAITSAGCTFATSAARKIYFLAIGN